MAGKALTLAIEEVESHREMDYLREDYGSVEYLDEDEETLMPVDYTDIAYDEWNIKMSLRVKGIKEVFWNCFLRLRMGPDEMKYDNMETRYLTLLYRVSKSVSLHEKYENVLIDLYTGYMREIVENYGANVDVSYYLVRCLG